jgi:hypothetical protein
MSPPEIVDRLKRHGVDPNDVFNANGDLLENDKYHLVSSGGGMAGVLLGTRAQMGLSCVQL